MMDNFIWGSSILAEDFKCNATSKKKKQKRQWKGTISQHKTAKENRKKMNKLIEKEIDHEIYKKGTKPTILFELSEKEYQQLKDVSIEVTHLGVIEKLKK